MKQFIIGEQLLQGIANYLGERPFREVVGLISEIQKLQEVPNMETKLPVQPIDILDKVL